MTSTSSPSHIILLPLLLLCVFLSSVSAGWLGSAPCDSDDLILPHTYRYEITPQVKLVLNLSYTVLQYGIEKDGELWLQSGLTAFYLDDAWSSVDNGTLKLYGTALSQDETVLGPRSTLDITWISNNNQLITTSFQAYSGLPALVFATRWPNGNKSPLSDRNAIQSCFPSWQQDESKGFISYGGDFLKYTKGGRWLNSNPQSTIFEGLSSGPTLLIDESTSFTGMLSSFDQFMVNSQQNLHDALGFGLIGTIDFIPVNYSLSTILVWSSSPLAAIEQWGVILRTQYATSLHKADVDYTTQWLGYNTDNGAYYYYLTEPNKNYYETLLDVYAYAQQESIPYSMILLDSWWYFKGDINGVKNWTAMPSVFPDGIAPLTNYTGWQVIAHNRYWSDNTDYARANGGDFDFVIDPNTHAAMPTEERFWDYLFETSKRWGLNVYEQDWLYNEFEGLTAATQNITLARQWLMTMGASAQKHGITIQYCMPYARHVLQSLEIPAVTQIRASDDYQPGNDQWQIGLSTLLYTAIGVAPFKDNFWTTQYQPGNPYGDNEPAPSLESAIATLSTGPVTPGDKIGLSDVSLILKSCRSDGMLLKPDVALHAIDSMIYALAFGANGPIGHVYHTLTNMADMQWHMLLVAQLEQPYTLNLTELNVANISQVYTVYEWSNATAVPVPSTFSTFSQQAPLSLPSCGKVDFRLFYIAPILANGWTLIGEVSKWVYVSSNRILSLDADSSPDQVVLHLTGAVNEPVTMLFRYNDANVLATCNISEDTTILMTVNSDGSFNCQQLQR